MMRLIKGNVLYWLEYYGRYQYVQLKWKKYCKYSTVHILYCIYSILLPLQLYVQCTRGCQT